MYGWTSVSRRHFSYALAMTVAGLCSSLPSFAQNYPNRPITIVVPGPPGGGTDQLGRALGQSITSATGQPVIIEHKPGASGTIAGQVVAKAAPDGYTILFTSGVMQNASHLTKTPYDMRKDFTFIAQLGIAPLVLAVNKDVPAKNVDEFLKWARANKGKLSYASYGAGSAGHLISQFLSQSRNLDMAHAAYKGDAPMLQDVLGGHVPWCFVSVGSVFPYLQSGQIRALAVTTKTRLEELPNVPTMTEVGMPDPEMNWGSWVGVLAPAGLPAPVLAALEKFTMDSLNAPEMKRTLKMYSMQMTAKTSAEFRKDFEEMDPILARLVEASGAKTQ